MPRIFLLMLLGLQYLHAGSLHCAEPNLKGTRPNDEDRLVARHVIETLEANHISRRRFDGVLYKRTLENLLDTLDGRRLLFSQFDLQPYFDDANLNTESIRAGDPTALFRLVELWQARLSERLSQFKASQAEANVPDQGIRFENPPAVFAATRQELDDRWQRRVRFELSLIRLLCPDSPNPMELLVANYRDSLTEWEKKFDPLTISLDAVARAYDPHSGYWGAEENSYFLCSRRFRLINEKVGIGIESTWLDGFMVVTAVRPGSSAAQQKMTIGDRIVAVADETGSKLFIPDSWNAVSTHRFLVGKPGTSVRLLVRSFKPNTQLSTIGQLSWSIPQHCNIIDGK
jgi:carboxyl-terminal processing protease